MEICILKVGFFGYIYKGLYFQVSGYCLVVVFKKFILGCVFKVEVIERNIKESCRYVWYFNKDYFYQNSN